jgi:hypothetical protein
MIRIAISAAAFEAIAGKLSLAPTRAAAKSQQETRLSSP